MNELTVVQKQFEPLMPRLEAALGPAIAHLPLPRLMQTIWVSIEQNPKLLDANRQSLFNAALTFAFLGLEVDGATGQGYLIPFKARVQPVIGYKGYNTLAARSGITINGDVVREGDIFDFELGSGPFVHHRPKLGGTDRKIIGAWATASANNRPPIVAVMGIDELLAIKARAPGGKSSDSPWNDPRIGFPAMCTKTAKRRLARGLPLNVFQQAARLEEAFEEQGIAGYIDPDRGVVTEREPIEPPTAAMLTQSPERGATQDDTRDIATSPLTADRNFRGASAPQHDRKSHTAPAPAYRGADTPQHTTGTDPADAVPPSAGASSATPAYTPRASQDDFSPTSPNVSRNNVRRETLTPTEPAHALKEPELDIPGAVGRHRIACSAAADAGTKELQRVWNTIPFGIRASLQATFDKQWWPRALVADRKASEREEKLL